MLKVRSIQGLVRGALALGVLAFGAAAVAVPGLTAEAVNESATESAHGDRHAVHRIQAGERLVLLGVTTDNHAIYQDGMRVLATELKPGARQQLVATSPPGTVSFAYTVGKVAFVWTSPNRSVAGFGVSPLVVWSAASGARKASDDSPIGTFTTSASADGRHVMYTTRANADGSAGDIEFASTDMTVRQTLAASVPMAFPFGACRPWGSFVGRGQRSHPVALFCEGGAATATLASWTNRGDGRRTLLTGVLTQPLFTASPDGTEFFTALADSRTPVVVSDTGVLRRLEEGVLSRRGFFTARGNVYYSAFADITKPGEIHRAPVRGGSPSFVADQLQVFLTNQAGSDLIVTPPASPDGRKLAYTTGFDPATGLNDIRVADLVNAGSQTVEAAQRAYVSGPVFSADSAYTLFARVDDLSTGNGQLMAAGPRGTFAIGSPTLASHDRLRGDRIAFNDKLVIDPNDFFRSTADLNVVDLSRPTRSLTLIEAQAYLAYLPSHRGRALVYTSARGTQGPGLYLARWRLHREDD